jgi:DNA-binding FrmR family transcriptional regulator
MDKFFNDPIRALDFFLRVLCWALMATVYFSTQVFYPHVAQSFRTPYPLLAEGITLIVLSRFATTPALRDLREILFYEWLWLLIWNGAFFADCDWYVQEWFHLHLAANWMSLIAIIRFAWFATPGARFATDWPIFGIIGFLTRARHQPVVAPTVPSSILVWLIIWLCYPLAWYCTIHKVDTAAGWLMVSGGYMVLYLGKRAANAFAAHIIQAQQNDAELEAVLPQIAALQAALAKAAENYPQPRTRAEAQVAMQKWLSADELAVLNAMREAHPRVIPMLVDSILNLAGNIPRPPIRLVSKQDEE